MVEVGVLGERYGRMRVPEAADAGAIARLGWSAAMGV